MRKKLPRVAHFVEGMDDFTREEAIQLLDSGTLSQRLIDQKGYDVSEAVTEEDANSFSSHIVGRPGFHAPVLDIDFQAELVPSSTPGHFHLYLEKQVHWEKYKKLLLALEDCGIISKGYARASITRGATYVRKPGVYKKKDSVGS